MLRHYFIDVMFGRKLYINKNVNNSAFKYLINLKFEQKIKINKTK